MTLPNPADSLSSAPQPARPPLLRHALTIGMVILVTASALWALWPRSVEIPNPDLSAAYAEVAQVIRESRSDLEAHVTSGAAWGDFGLVLGAHEFVPEAMQCFSRAAELAPHDPRWPYFQGHLIQTREPLKSARHFEQAATRATAPQAAFALSRAAETYLLGEDVSAAQRAIEAALAANSDEPQAHYTAARIAYARRDWEQARASIERTIELRPLNRDVLELQSQILRQLGEREKADEIAARAAKLSADSRNWPDPWLGDLLARRVDPYWRLHQASQAHLAGHSQHARELLLPIVMRHPDHAAFAQKLAAIEFETGRIDAAIDVLNEALGHHPRSAELLGLRGSCWLLKEQWSGAEDDLRAATTINPKRSADWVNLAFALRRQRKFADAEPACETALKLDPQFLPARVEHVDLKLDQQQREEAAALFMTYFKDIENEPAVERLRERLR